MAEYKIKGQPAHEGMQLQFKGERGTYTLKTVTWSKEGLISLNCVGGPAGHYSWRSFRPDKVKKVL